MFNLDFVINLVTSGHQKWDGKSTLFRPTFKSETDFTVPAVCSVSPDWGIKIKCNRASGASEKIFEKIRGKQCKYVFKSFSLSSLLNFSFPPIFTKICMIFVPSLVLSRTQAASMLRWSRRPCQRGLGRSPSEKANLVHFSHKIRHLVAPILAN